jgi:hypothetical protein
MNGRNAKAIRREAKVQMVEWLQSLLEGEERDRINTDNIFEYIPKQTHVMNFGMVKLSIFSYRWFIKILKRGDNPKDYMNV